MEVLHFELSVLFTKTGLNPISSNKDIKDEYRTMFRKEVKDEELNRVLGIIIEDQISYNNGFVIEVPEDYELKQRDDI